jgi:hypothetical protein
MAETTTRQLPAPFIEALGKTYADQLTKQVGKPVDTSKFAPSSCTARSITNRCSGSC